MKGGTARDLESGYTVEVGALRDEEWHRLLVDFDDGNIFQTCAYGSVTSGRRNLRHLRLWRGGDVVAIAQARIAKLPGLPVGIAYIRWGPLWRRKNTDVELEVFRQAIRALRNEFACRRGLVVRLLPALFEGEALHHVQILAEEGFGRSNASPSSKTILMDLRPPLEDLRDGMRPHWKRELKLAERKDLEVVYGTGDDLFASMIEIHQEMVARKKFAEGSDINQFRRMQAELPDRLKMGVMLCRSNAEVCAGVIWSAIGSTGIYLFGATSNAGMKRNGSYLLQWQLIGRLQAEGRDAYDLNGVNATTNPGTYKFKRDLAGINGREVSFVGQYETIGGRSARIFLCIAERIRASLAHIWPSPRWFVRLR